MKWVEVFWKLIFVFGDVILLVLFGLEYMFSELYGTVESMCLRIINFILAKEWVEGRLVYNSQNDRYGLLASDLWEHDGFHCGECLQIWVEGEWIDTSMEMDWSTGKGVWYLTGTPFRGNMLEYIRARIEK